MKNIKLFNVEKDFLTNKKSYIEGLKNFMSSGRYILGKNVAKLEKKLCNVTGAKYCVTTSNGTDSLEIAMRAININPNDEVIVPAFTWISTASSVKIIRAKPIFCDIELESYGLDYAEVIKKITKKTKAVIIVSLYGIISRDFFKIKKLCKKHKITLIEDAAQSFGSSLGKYNSCNIADISTTSFFPTKSLGGYGDGGAIFTNKKKLATKIKLLKQNGTLDKKKFNFIGRNARFDEIQACLILEKLKRFNLLLSRKRNIAKTYFKFLNILSNKKQEKNFLPSYSLFTIRVKNRIKFLNFLKKKKIQYGVYYNYILPDLKIFKTKEHFKNSKKASLECCSIPINEWLTDKEVSYIVKQINYFNKLN